MPILLVLSPHPLKKLFLIKLEIGIKLEGKKKMTFEALDSQTQVRFGGPYERPKFCQKAVGLAKMLVSIRSC